MSDVAWKASEFGILAVMELRHSIEDFDNNTISLIGTRVRFWVYLDGDTFKIRPNDCDDTSCWGDPFELSVNDSATEEKLRLWLEFIRNVYDSEQPLTKWAEFYPIEANPELPSASEAVAVPPPNLLAVETGLDSDDEDRVVSTLAGNKRVKPNPPEDA